MICNVRIRLFAIRTHIWQTVCFYFLLHIPLQVIVSYQFRSQLKGIQVAHITYHTEHRRTQFWVCEIIVVVRASWLYQLFQCSVYAFIVSSIWKKPAMATTQLSNTFRGTLFRIEYNCVLLPQTFCYHGILLVESIPINCEMLMKAIFMGFDRRSVDEGTKIFRKVGI